VDWSILVEFGLSVEDGRLFLVAEEDAVSKVVDMLVGNVGRLRCHLEQLVMHLGPLIVGAPSEQDVEAHEILRRM